MPRRHPIALPIVNNGASVPPDVPLPREIAQERNFQRHSEISMEMGSSPDSAFVMFSYPTPNVAGANVPIMPTASPPNAGHHIQWIGSFSKRSSII
jgi:hypothetical protein